MHDIEVVNNSNDFLFIKRNQADKKYIHKENIQRYNDQADEEEHLHKSPLKQKSKFKKQTKRKLMTKKKTFEEPLNSLQKHQIFRVKSPKPPKILQISEQKASFISKNST
jgi:hypothetical protein